MTELDWMRLAEWLGFVGLAAGGVKALLMLGKAIGNKIHRMFGINKIQSDVLAIQDSVAFLVAELTPNGGYSIRDSITRIERSVVANSERMRSRMTNDPDMIFEADAQGRWIWVNRTLSRVIGRTPTELMGYGWANSVDPLQRDALVESWFRAVEEEREFEGATQFRSPEDVWFDGVLKSYRMNDHHGGTIGYLGTITRV